MKLMPLHHGGPKDSGELKWVYHKFSINGVSKAKTFGRCDTTLNENEYVLSPSNVSVDSDTRAHSPGQVLPHQNGEVLLRATNVVLPGYHSTSGWVGGGVTK